MSLTNVAVLTPAEVHAHYGNQEANTLMTTPAVPTEKSFPKLLFMPNHWAPYFMAAQTPYQVFCTWQTLLATMLASRFLIGSGQLASAPEMEMCNARDRPLPSNGAVSSPTEVFSAGQQNAWLHSAFPCRYNNRTPTSFHPSHQALPWPRLRYQNGEPSRPRKTASSTRHHRSSLVRTNAHPSMT